VPSSDPAQRFGDIIENIERIERFTAGMELDRFAATEQTVIAVKYCLLMISEAAVKLGDLAAISVPPSRGEKFAAWAIVCGMITAISMSPDYGA